MLAKMAKGKDLLSVPCYGHLWVVPDRQNHRAVHVGIMHGGEGEASPKYGSHLRLEFS